MVGEDWIAGLPRAADGFDMIQNHVDPAVLSHGTDTGDGRRTAQDTALFMMETRLPPRRSGGQWKWATDSKFSLRLGSEVTVTVFKAF
jgi:hypothetical protein